MLSSSSPRSLLLAVVTGLHLTIRHTFAATGEIECFQCESEYGGIKCDSPCRGEVCVVWKWQTKSELQVKQVRQPATLRNSLYKH
ncbi:unnamed protein product [Heligmosomoides polygyrus]|uniref:Secreted protein n=1 Tax=Heligmosomoides polygyrus TaxID=6339 RepID=A0A183GAX9_HELPZ|nr:unnamed protein product [Heligmosomoides polygyrus]